MRQYFWSDTAKSQCFCFRWSRLRQRHITLEEKAWREGTIYLTVWRTETHHHRANCRKHKELPANTEKFKYCPISEESHHCLETAFPVEILARDAGIMWQRSVCCWKNGLPGLLHGRLPTKLVVSGWWSPIHTFSMGVFRAPRLLLYVFLIFYPKCTPHLLA